MPIVLPAPPARRLSAAEAGDVAYRGRKLLRRGRISHRAYCLLDCLLWSCRDPRTGAIVVSYTRLVQLAHQSREAIAAGLRQLEAVRLLTRIKRTVLVIWRHGGRQARQAVNAYLLHPAERDHHEFGKATVSRVQEILSFEPPNAAVAEAQAALARRRAVVERQLLAEQRTRMEAKGLGKTALAAA